MKEPLLIAEYKYGEFPFTPDGYHLAIVTGLKNHFHTIHIGIVRFLQEAVDIGVALNLPVYDKNEREYIYEIL